MRLLVVSFLAGAVLLYAMGFLFPTWLDIAIGAWALFGVVVFGLCMAGAAAAGDRMSRDARERQEKAQEWAAWDDIYKGRGSR